MTKKGQPKDPELENLLRAFREVNPAPMERDRWRSAIADELRTAAPAPSPRGGARLYRIVARTAIQVAVAASFGFVIGAYFIERRYAAGQSMLFSPSEPTAPAKRPPLTMDEEREVVRIRLDPGVSP